MPDTNDVGMPLHFSCLLSRKLAPWWTFSNLVRLLSTLSDKFLWSWKIAYRCAYISTETFKSWGLKIPENQFELCHCRHTFQLNVDGFGKERKEEKCQETIKIKGEIPQWHFKNGRQTSRCAYDILLYENMMRVSTFITRQIKWTATLWNSWSDFWKVINCN